MEKMIDVIIRAILYEPDLITGDNINALAGGHGMLNVSAFCAANAIAEEMLKGCDIKVKANNQPMIDLDQVIEAGVVAAIERGADPANAALIVATLCYIAGSNVRAGVPSGNRKLGALARMKAKVQKGAVAIMPTPKSNNKISGFPAVLKIYEAMMEGRLTRVNGSNIPTGVGGALCGHSTLGEDIIFPEIAENAADIGTSAMIRAYAGAGMRPNPFISAVIGAAAALEIVHPDAPAPDRFGPSFKINISTIAGMGAVKAAGLPETLHFRVTGEEYLTAKLVGDLGIILKDMGVPTVVGMLAFYDLFGCFAEAPKIGMGGSGGPRTAPIGHVLADASMALRMIYLTHSEGEAAEIIRKNKEGFIDPEFACIEANTLGRKVERLRGGPVSRSVVQATAGQTEQAIRSRAIKCIEDFRNGKSLTEIIQHFEQQRIQRVEAGVAKIMSESLRKTIRIQITKLQGGARRAGDRGRNFFVLDPDIDVIVTIDGEEIFMNGFAHRVIPDAVLTKDQKKGEAITIAALAVSELLATGHTLIDLEVPVAIATLLKIKTPTEAALEAERKATLAMGGLPRAIEKAKAVAELALGFYQH